MRDARESYIINCIESLCSSNGENQEVKLSSENLQDQEALSTFLNDPACSILQANVHKPEEKDHFQVKLNCVYAAELGGGKGNALKNWSADGILEIHFVKHSAELLTEKNLSTNLQVLSMVQSPLHSLYQIVNKVYAPMLLRSDEWSSKMSQKLKDVLAELDLGLESTVKYGEDVETSGDDIRGGIDEHCLLGIITPIDEFKYWESNAFGKNRQRGKIFGNCFDMIQHRFGDLLSLNFDEVMELIEDTQNAVDDIWRADLEEDEVYPQARMCHFFNLISASINRYIVNICSSINIWKGNFHEVKNIFCNAVLVCEKWIQVTNELSGTFWPSYSEHPWIGEKHSNTQIHGFMTRLIEISNIRTTYEELLSILPSNEKKQCESLNCFDTFEKLHPLHCNPYTVKEWKHACNEFEEVLSPIDTQISRSLLVQLSKMSNKPQSKLRFLKKYSHLLKRSKIRESLRSERETLLAQLSAQLDQLEGELDQKMSSMSQRIGNGKNLSPTVEVIVYCHQFSSRVSSLNEMATDLLSDLPSFDSFSSSANGVVNKVNSLVTEQVRSWQEEVTDIMRDGEISLEMSGRLMQIDIDGNLSVNYSERLVTLLREVRQLNELNKSVQNGKLGKWVPKKVQSIVEEGERYYHFGVTLKKVGNYYNTMESQIIPEQKPLLLDSLLAFEQVVNNPSVGNTLNKNTNKKVTWNNTEECEEYVERLQSAADRLSSENRKLRGIHSKLSNDMVTLMDIDLLKYPQKWKCKWDEIKLFMATSCKKYEANRLKKWQLHWDHQLYKVLEASYQQGLESLNENLPEIKVELIFSQKGILQFKPPLEELRANYYKSMKKFISRPNQFKGFGNGQVFRKMCDANASSVVQVYQNAEDLFYRLDLVRADFEPWAVLAKVSDFDSIFEKFLNDANDWDVNFKMIKAKRKESEKIPDFLRVDCISVSAVPFKSTLDDTFQNFKDTLVYLLRASILSHLKTVDAYLEKSNEILNKRPHSIEEIGLAKEEWKTIDSERNVIEKECKVAEKKKNLLITVAGANIDTNDVVVRLSEIPTRWESFEISLEAFNEMIEEQRESLKGEIENKVMECNIELDKFGQRWNALKPTEINSWENEEIHKIYESLEEWREQFNELLSLVKTLRDNSVAFQMPIPHFQGLEEVEVDISNCEAIWQLYKDFCFEWDEFSKHDWITFRSRIFDLQDFSQKWIDLLKTKDRSAQVIQKINEKALQIKRAMPTLKFCRGEPFKEEHWTQLFRKVGIPKGIRLDNLMTGHFLDVLHTLEEPGNLQFVKVLQARAQGEVTIREALQELRAWTETAELSLLVHEDNNRTTYLIKEWKDVTLELGDNQSLLSSLKESQFFKPFADQAVQYETKMAALEAYLSSLNIIQRKWIYLEPIFGRGALPSEQGRFKRVDEDFRDIMERINMEPKLFNLADEVLFPHLGDRVNTMLDQLERCQKALADFLEEKRSKMPRFYFIGDDDLLEILGQAKNPVVIQNHLKKLFQGIFKVNFSENLKEIVAMVSSSTEVVPFERAVEVTDEVEEWLTALSKQMKHTLRVLIARCVHKTPDYNDFPSQVLCVAEQIKFTDRISNAIAKNSLSELKTNLQDTILELTSLDLSNEPLMQLKIKALVLDLVHHIDVVDQLQKENCVSCDEWIWQKQLRFYLEGKDENVVIKMNNAIFDYTYEYQGNAAKLVHTPLTDKCYLTLTQGMHMGFGGNPYGPAGTGKTESVKALGGQFGRQVLVFNCDEGIDFKSMGRILLGLVKSGAWGCFDEFNRLKEDQLSAISQQIQVIQDAIKEKNSTILLLNQNVDVDFNAGIFVTLNPAGKGYGGRSKLPDNLKALFRPVAMGRPDNNLIAEVILYSEGFAEAKDIASKVVSLYTLSRQLLSPQQHYDWGLRALKAVLNTGGKLLQSSKKQRYDNSDSKLTSGEETEILIKAVRVNTLSKLTFADATLFLALIGDVFPGIKSSDVSGGELEEAIRETMKGKQFSLNADDTQIRKMLQLKESLDQRMGCVIVGPSGSGKSVVWKVLQHAMIKCGQMVKTYVMNPKSMPRQRLLGHMDLDTREWFDGVLTDAARKVVKEPSDIRSWVVCDGDVDPEWIESLNSVLDDNHLLTLPNGERINFGSNVNFLFETHDLCYASPATISRMGMIFLSDQDMDLHRVLGKWLNQQFPEDCSMKVSTSNWLEEFFQRALSSVMKLEFVVETTVLGAINNGLSHLAGAQTRSEFVCRLIYGLGSNLEMASRSSFAKETFMYSNERPPDLGAPLDCYCEGDTYFLFELRRDTYNSSDGELNEKDLQKGCVVPTVHVQRALAIIKPWVERMEPFLLVGPEGSGKNMLIQWAFSQVKATTVTVLHCNAQTTADHVIQKISQSCSLFSTNSGRVYRPRDADRLVLYLKDINLPKPDQYGSCMLIAFLQQLITFEGFYDSNLEFLKIEKIQIVASMNPATTVGRHPLSTRFTAIVRVAYIDYPSNDELTSVYSTLFEAVVNTMKNRLQSNSKWEISSNREKLANNMVDLYAQLRQKFSVDDQRHYLFTPRDLTHWIIGIMKYDLSQEELLDVWAYEAKRLFRDRLVDTDSRNKFDIILNGIVKQHWKHTCDLNETYFTALSSCKKGQESQNSSSTLVRIEKEQFSNCVLQGIHMYEREEKELHMLLFDEILDHIACVDGVISQDCSSLLLVGNSGVGRRTSVTLVAHMHGYHFFSPSISRCYNVKNFRLDLKNVLTTSGISGEHCILFLEDHQFEDESILETINSLLSSGEVPGLYTHEELDPLLSPIKELMMESTVQYKTVYEFFIARVQKNLHIVLSMDPSHALFRLRCESNPALYTRCTIIWMGEWRSKSMLQVPSLLLKNSELGESDMKDDLFEYVHVIYNSCRSLGATPREYISFLQTWQSLNESKTVELKQELLHLKGGLNKLEEASDTVDDLSKNAAIQQKELAAAQISADEAMEEITLALSSATDNRREVEELKKDLAVAETETQSRKAEIEEELSSITPILQSAKEAVGNIKSDNINEIRSLKMPPEPIHDVLSAVLMLLGIQDTSWNSMKKFLGNRGVKDDILNFDAHRVTPDIRKSVAKLLKNKASSFQDENIYRVSIAAAPLASWVKANIRYSFVLDKIQPLEKELSRAVRSLEVSQEKLQSCESELKEIDDKVGKMKIQFSEKTKEAERLRSGLEKAQATLDKAQGLISQLGGEKKRWSEQEKSFENQISVLPLKMLIAAGFTTFLGQTSEDLRESLIKEWMDNFNLSTSFDYRRLMSSESELLTWKAMGLPADNLSMENALVVNFTQDKCPFIVDPANACSEWLQAHLAKDETRPLSVVLAQDARFSNEVEQAVRFGKTLVILEVGGVEPYLFPLIRKDLCHEGPRFVVQLGDKIIDYNENFRMFLVTRNPDPDLPPNARAIVTEVNFTVTKSGLEGQLLGVTIEHEQPALEEQKGELLRQEEDFKVQLAALEKQLLEALATSEGDILENTALLDSLTRTKSTAAEIETSLVKSAEKSEELDIQRNTYRTFAKDGAKLFFLIKKLHAVNHMYHFSLASFIGLFKDTLSSKMEAVNVKERLSRLTPILENKVLMFVGRSLFKKDRVMFGIHLVHGMHSTLFQEREWDYFIGLIVPTINTNQESKSSGGGKDKFFPDWAAPDRMDQFRVLHDVFPRLVQCLKFDSVDMWSRWARSSECENDFHPKLDKSLSLFQRVLVVLTLRPDRLHSAIQSFVCQVLGIKSLTPPPLDLKQLYLQETSPSTPVLMITTAGADPSKELEDFATETIGREKYIELAMGGGQQEQALTLLEQSSEAGDWLCLQNLHLVVSWLVVLEKQLNTLTSHNQFRLWLTAEAHDLFPLILLQQSLKITFESPPGIKKNLQRTYATWNSEFLLRENSPLRCQLLFLLAWFHAVSQERRTYIPQGWTKFYEFSFGDLRAGSIVMALAAAGSKGGKVEWKTVHGLMENAIYGGRVDNPYDLRVLRSYLDLYMNDSALCGQQTLVPGSKVFVPNSTNHVDFMEEIESLPDTDAPMVFGLPDNIDRSVQRTTSAGVIKQLRELSSSSEGGSKFDREKWRVQLGPIFELWGKLSSHAKKSLHKNGKKNMQDVLPVDAFVYLENSAAQDLFDHVDFAIENLKKTVYGSALLTPSTQTIATSFLSMLVPNEWMNRWDGPENIKSWLRALAIRKVALSEWMSYSIANNLLNHPLQLSELLNPGTFLNAVRQQTARKLKCSMDGLKLVSSWSKEPIVQMGSVVVEISGLLLQGAAFEGNILREASADALELVSVPSVYIAYVDQNEREPYAKNEALLIPVYYSATRERQLVDISMPVSGDKHKWILSGVALFLAEE